MNESELKQKQNEEVSSTKTPPAQTIIIQQSEKKQSNGIGTAGFVLSLIGLVLCWIPILNTILWILGLIFSSIGVFKKPKGLAIAGLCISCLAIIILIFLIGLFAIATAI